MKRLGLHCHCYFCEPRSPWRTGLRILALGALGILLAVLWYRLASVTP